MKGNKDGTIPDALLCDEARLLDEWGSANGTLWDRVDSAFASSNVRRTSG